MTACLYVSPRRTPGELGLDPMLVLAADTLGMLDPRHVEPEAVRATPANLPSLHLTAPKATVLRRKIVIFGSTALAFSGHSHVIEEVLRNMPYKLPEWSETPRPMKELGQYVDNLAGLGHSISVAGIFVRGREVHHIAPQSKQITTQHLGLCGAAGSGANDVLEQCRWFDILVQDNQNIQELSTQIRICQFINSLNSVRLCEEILQTDETWGGYFESVYFDGQEWQYTPSWMHIFFLATPVGTDGFEVALLTRYIAYNPDPGRILTIGEPTSGHWRLTNLLEPEVDESSNYMRHWDGWKPEFVGAHVVLRTPGVSRLHMPLLLNKPQVESMNITISNGDVDFGIPDAVCDTIFGELTRLTGRKRVGDFQMATIAIN